MKRILLSIGLFPIFLVYMYALAFSWQEIKNNPQIQAVNFTLSEQTFLTSIDKLLTDHNTPLSFNTDYDTTQKVVKTYLKNNKSVMLASADGLVAAAKKYEIDPILMVAIAQCESNLGDKMPHKTEDKYECHNPFGWGIHSKGTLCFDTWEQSYLAVAKGLRKKYANEGLITPGEIMPRYTPPALEKGGSWAKCVTYFVDKINTYQNFAYTDKIGN